MGEISNSVSMENDACGAPVSDYGRDIKSITYHPYGHNLTKSISFTDGSGVSFDYLPDGTCRKILQKQRIVSTVAETQESARAAVRYITDMRIRRGSFEKSDFVWRTYCPEGFYDFGDKKFHYVQTDYQGSMRAVYSDNGNGRAEIEQLQRYFPSGYPISVRLPQIAQTAPLTDRLHNGKMWINQNGLGSYFNDARLHNALSSAFTTPDPLASSTPNISPYVHCAADPINFADWNGKEFTSEAIKVLDSFTENYVCNLSDEELRNQIIKEIEQMRKSAQIFHINTIMGCRGAIKYNTSMDQVVMDIPNLPDLIAHELKHGFDFLNGEMSLSIVGETNGYSLLYDENDEKAAYDRGVVFGGDSWESMKNKYNFKVNEKNEEIINNGRIQFEFTKTINDENVREIGYQNISNYFRTVFRIDNKTFKPNRR